MCKIKIYIKHAFSLLVIFFITFGICIHTPMHSDDYLYALKGLSISEHLKHYESWSGRIVADYISTAMLSIPELYRAAINASALTLTIYLIFLIGKLERKNDNFDSVKILFIFTLYWISNANIGQTTFWIVGSANYLWTNMFICAYILCVIRKSNIYLTGIFAVIAGCSNENTGAVVVILSLAYYLYNSFNEKCILNRSLVYPISSLAGFIALISAPGNYERAKSFSAWYSKPISERIVEHLYTRLPDVISLMWPLLLSIAIIAIINLYGEKKDTKSTSLSLIFLISAVISSFIMFAAPSYPPRSANGTLILMLIATSFMLKNSFSNKIKSILTSVLFLLSLIYFIPQYVWMYNSYKGAYAQSIVREQLINKQISQGKRELRIPDFYFSKLAKVGDKFDPYHNKWSYGKYFGVLSVERDIAKLDYSVIMNGKKIAVNKNIIPHQADIRNIYISSNGNIAFETNRNMTLPKDGDLKIFLHIKYKGKEKVMNYDFYPDSMNFDGGFLTGVNVASGDISWIEFGLFKGEERFTDIKINL
ncbi:TPA: hypothetical protein PC505_002485 [Morganella morganii]|nr:hypothetical protein [Morganella morganii]HDF2423063.1 hypothetical protein [Morganella morganii]